MEYMTVYSLSGTTFDEEKGVAIYNNLGNLHIYTSKHVEWMMTLTLA